MSRRSPARLRPLFSLLAVVSLTGSIVAGSPVGPASAATDGSVVKGCPYKVLESSTRITSQRWTVPRTYEIVSPATVTLCRFDAGRQPFALIVATYRSSSQAIKAMASLTTKDPYVYLGIPSGFVGASRPVRGVYAGSVSSDDCGRFGDEVFDTSCPQGRASMVRVGDKIWVLSNRFELKGLQLRSAPSEQLRTILERR